MQSIWCEQGLMTCHSKNSAALLCSSVRQNGDVQFAREVANGNKQIIEFIGGSPPFEQRQPFGGIHMNLL
ncbi:hypothetical protein HMPREF9123_0007 [Neisseria bacilliformis ATCC BAA-1200]|uniref:Uncharacterized protein n=1 Tax=Neisseria bacilliformis ATCC BAA-1200 TaxID=888742 RepID=F2B8F4_9NEIS|nr:hypothetical protein HMPREF9123_0007 [Neisseria bacilliformis ATCC BAA-1200]